MTQPSIASTSIVAHRGASNLARENTLEAFQIAIELAADFIELDVRRTKDNVLIAFHDATIAHQRMSELTYQEANDYAHQFGFTIPTLEQVIGEIKGKIKALIELKEEHYEAEIVHLLASQLEPEDFFVISFQPHSLKTIKSAFPTVRVGLLLSRNNSSTIITQWHHLEDQASLTEQLGFQPDIVLPNYDLLGLLNLNLCHHPVKIPLFVWTVDQEEALQKLLETPLVQGIITNRPDVAIALQKRLADSSLT